MSMNENYELLIPTDDGYKDVKKISIDGVNVWKRAIPNTKSGTVSLSIAPTRVKPLLEWSITGNTVQDGTPSPDNPVEVKGVGEKTENLFDFKEWSANAISNITHGNAIYDGNSITLNSTEDDCFTANYNVANAIDIKSLTTYTLSWNISNTQWDGVTYIFEYSADGNRNITTATSFGKQLTFTTLQTTVKISIRFGIKLKGGTQTFSNIMLNEGSTALPYEPYGYKMLVTSEKTDDITIIGVQPTTNYAYFYKNILPTVQVGDYVNITVDGIDYRLQIMQIDDNYIYIENKQINYFVLDNSRLDESEVLK